MKNKKKYEVIPFDKFLDKQYGKKGTKRRASHDKEMERIRILLEIRDLVNKALGA